MVEIWMISSFTAFFKLSLMNTVTQKDGDYVLLQLTKNHFILKIKFF